MGPLYLGQEPNPRQKSWPLARGREQGVERDESKLKTRGSFTEGNEANEERMTLNAQFSRLNSLRWGLGRRGEVLEAIWAGKCTKEIAADLRISPKTVEYHRACLYRLFGVRDLVSLCRRAMAVGLIEPDESCAR